MIRIIDEDLREASANGDESKVQQLISQGANVNSSNKVNGWTALHWASYRGHRGLVMYLLNKGADPTITNNKGETVLGMLSNYTLDLLDGQEVEEAEQYPLPTQQDTLAKLPIIPNYIKNPEFPYLKKELIQVQPDLQMTGPTAPGIQGDPKMQEFYNNLVTKAQSEKDSTELLREQSPKLGVAVTPSPPPAAPRSVGYLPLRQPTPYGISSVPNKSVMINPLNNNVSRALHPGPGYRPGTSISGSYYSGVGAPAPGNPGPQQQQRMVHVQPGNHGNQQQRRVLVMPQGQQGPPQTVTVSEYPVHRMQQVPIRNHPHSQQGPGHPHSQQGPGHPHSQQGPGHPHSQQSPYLVRSAAPNYFMQQPQSGMLPGNVPLPPGHPGNVPPGHPALQMHHQHPSGPSLQQHSVPPVQHPVPPVQHPTVTYSNKDLQVHKDQQGHPALHKDQQLVVPDSVSSTSDSEKKDFTTPLKKSPPGSPVSVNSSPTTDATIKIRRSGSGDFFEVELADIGDTYSSLRKCFAEELDVEESSVCKIRKLPNILIRKDRDIKRIKHGAEFEVEVAEEMS